MNTYRNKDCVHVITSLGTGGAESVLYSLVIHNKMNKQAIISLKSPSFYSAKFEENGIYTLHLYFDKPCIKTIINLWKSFRLMLSSRLVLSYLYHADLFASLIKIFPSSPPLIWNIHNALGPNDNVSPKTRKIIKALAHLSSLLPNAIIYVSNFARYNHEFVGYNNKNTYTILNPINTNRFCRIYPNKPIFLETIRDTAFEEPKKVKFGVISRYHRVKRHREILEAFKIVIQSQKEVHLVLAGNGCDEENAELSASIDELEVRDHITLLGNIEKTELLYPYLDFTILFSSSESFGNVIAESLACGIPVLVSNLPVFKEIFEDIPIYADDVNMLASQMLYSFNMVREDTGAYQQLARKGIDHVTEKLDIKKCYEVYASLWDYFYKDINCVQK